MSDQPKLKCYYVWDDPDKGGVLVHAETPGKAKAAAFRTLYDEGYEFINLKAQRMPTLDTLPINLENASTVLRFEAAEYTDDGKEIPPFKDDYEFWMNFRCHCPICEKYREDLKCQPKS